MVRWQGLHTGSCYNDANDTSSQNANIFGSQQLLPLMNPLGPASQPTSQPSSHPRVSFAAVAGPPFGPSPL